MAVDSGRLARVCSSSVIVWLSSVVWAGVKCLVDQANGDLSKLLIARLAIGNFNGRNRNGRDTLYAFEIVTSKAPIDQCLCIRPIERSELTPLYSPGLARVEHLILEVAGGELGAKHVPQEL